MSHAAYRNFFVTSLAAGLLALSALGQAQEDPDETMVRAVEQKAYGAYLTDHEGMSLYMFDQDAQGGQSTCHDACANAWPPYTTNRPPEAGEGIDADKLGIIQREGDIQQVTYAGWPLYYFKGDKQAGDALGQNIRNMGGHWYLVSPEGQPITEGQRSAESPMEIAPGRGAEPASRGQEVHERTEDAEGSDYDT